jgi:hypothetical protein
MNTRIPFLALLSGCSLTAFLLCGHSAAADGDPETAVEKIVCIRHGEKPATDLGQLTCQGLNRALALPDVLISHYGKADFIFAPLTATRAKKSGKSYSYVRPLMTIEPTAIRLGLPVDTRFQFDDVEGLKSELVSAPYQRAVIFVAWEHAKLAEMLASLVKSLDGDPAVIPHWEEGDFDSIYLITIRTENGKRSVSFQQDHEGLNGLKTDCDGAAGK